jgi:hypothetical protein
MSDDDSGRVVRRRRVFYIPGYDPFPPRRYRELYRREGKAQAAISGYEIALRPKPAADGPYGWHVTATIDGHRTETDFTVLVWTDIVRRSMEMGVAATYLLLLRTFWIYLSTGVMTRLFRLRPGPVITAMYPVVMLLGQLAVALGLGWAAFRLGALAVPAWASGLVGLALVPALLRGFRRLDGRLYVYYLLHDYAFTAAHRGRNPPELEARMAGQVETIGAALASDVDEVLVVGHSSGAHLGVSVLADAIRAGHVRPEGPALAFLTLGQAIPMQSFLPQANRLRADLHFLSQSDALTWIDVSAPGDGCCYALCDPVSVSGAAPVNKRWPLVISAAFSKTLQPETWARLRRRFFRLHFQYLCAFDNPGDYDYFAITAGPRALADRFRGRKPSASRNERLLSPHTAREAA